MDPPDPHERRACLEERVEDVGEAQRRPHLRTEVRVEPRHGEGGLEGRVPQSGRPC
jgi:hypothetical protein